MTCRSASPASYSSARGRVVTVGMDEVVQADAGEPDPVGFRDQEGEVLADRSRGGDGQSSRQLAIACVAARS